MDQETVRNKQTPKRRYMKLYVAVGLVIFTIGAIFIAMNVLNEEEPEQSADVRKSEEPKQTASSVNFRMFDDRTVEITKYEMFYRGHAFYSKEAVEFYSLNETIQKYALFYHLEKHGYKWDDERRDQHRERVKSGFEYDMKDENLKAYYEKMFDALQITEEEYIEYYLLVNKEYEMLHQEVFNKGIGLDETGAYPSGEAELIYGKLVGITEDELNELAEKIPEQIEPMEPQPDLPFVRDEFGLKVTTNADGEYIFVHSSSYSMYFDETYREALYELEQEVVKEDLTRYSLKRYQEAVASYESDDVQKMQVINNLSLILEILERTIGMELM